MIEAVDKFTYQERYQCWDGSIIVTSTNALFGEHEIELSAYMESTSTTMTEEEYQTVCYIKNNFTSIYLAILQTLFAWQEKGFCFERYDRETHAFHPIEFTCAEDIHSYIGMPTVEIISGYVKEGYAFFAVYFSDCLLSIEHGLTALFQKNECIDIDASDTRSLIETLEHFEEDCAKWKRDFWKVKDELGTRFFDERDLVREKWLGSGR
ncbi:hypothetical protein [Brevibacillus sp. 179-C 1.1 NHS]|uniref:hypothetical protein n=1 Tax=Brevibacillus sp. 179-C 1.1 NHS TaxID=3235177 RepID=UPI0039A37FB3